MRQRRVTVGPRADRDIRRIGSHIAQFGAGPLTARRYLERLAAFVLGLAVASERGVHRPDLHAGLRVVPFEASALIAVVVTEETVAVMRVFYRGEDWEGSLRRQFRR